MQQSAGTTMVPVMGRSVPRVTCHVAPPKTLHAICCQGYRPNGVCHRCPTCRSHAPTINNYLLGFRPRGVHTARARGGKRFDRGSSSSGKCWRNTKFGTLIELDLSATRWYAYPYAGVHGACAMQVQAIFTPVRSYIYDQTCRGNGRLNEVETCRLYARCIER